MDSFEKRKKEEVDPGKLGWTNTDNKQQIIEWSTMGRQAQSEGTGE